MRFGMHLPFKGGPERAHALGCRALQIFCGNPRGWQKSPLDPDFVSEFRSEVAANDLTPLVVHATYLINLASPEDKIYGLSRDSFIIELQRCAQIGAQYYVIHAGNHKGSGLEAGRKRVAACMQAAVKAVPQGPVILAENTAGGGSTMGGTFEDVAALIDESATPRLGLCLDTCHAYASGCDLRTPAGARKLLDTIEKTVGLKRLHCLHLNDSKGELGSRLDRHEHIGRGAIGEAGFRALFSDKRVWNLPAILETPREKPEDELEDLWKAIGLAVEAGACTVRDAGPRPGAAETSAAEHLALDKRKPARAAKKKSSPATRRSKTK